MRVIRFVDESGNIRLGEEAENGQARVLAGSLYDGLQQTDDHATIQKLLAPLEPVNIYCIGLNYREHAAESGMAAPENPVVFMKPTSSLLAPGDPIVLPACQHDSEVDYECELAVVIGQPCRDVTQAEALQYVAGYTCGHDVSARHWQLQKGGGQWIRGKGFDTFCPLGPVLVTPDEIGDPQALEIRTILNGQTMQEHTTGDMIFSIAYLIHFLSQDTTLLPGTVILTGTPQGVGFARKPPIFLQAGDEVVIEIENIGRLVNPVVTAS
jgi:2-keto-4-pentenoate hydratase/2-oxohepta-3-ene-1,7-dioic acid hydratase in catechol pathway